MLELLLIFFSSSFLLCFFRPLSLPTHFSRIDKMLLCLYHPSCSVLDNYESVCLFVVLMWVCMIAICYCCCCCCCESVSELFVVAFVWKCMRVVADLCHAFPYPSQSGQASSRTVLSFYFTTERRIIWWGDGCTMLTEAFKFSRVAFFLPAVGNCDDKGKWSGRGMTGADDWLVIVVVLTAGTHWYSLVLAAQ